jgi:hypothetical protein
MEEQFAATRNPSLIRLGALLLSEARRAGVRGRVSRDALSPAEDLDANTQIEIETRERSTLRKLS